MLLHWPHPSALVVTESIAICTTACSGLCIASRSLRALSASQWISLVLGGLSIPSLRSLWGAVRNWQLYILRTCCKSCFFFPTFQFSFSLHDLPQKKILCTDDFFWYLVGLFFVITQLTANKNARLYCKKNYTT